MKNEAYTDPVTSIQPFLDTLGFDDQLSYHHGHFGVIAHRSKKLKIWSLVGSLCFSYENMDYDSLGMSDGEGQSPSYQTDRQWFECDYLIPPKFFVMTNLAWRQSTHPHQSCVSIETIHSLQEHEQIPNIYFVANDLCMSADFHADIHP